MNKLMKLSIMTGAVILGMSSLSLAKFNDIDENNYYLTPITALSEKGVINGYPDNTFKPANKVTRAEFAKMISIAEELKLNENNKKSFEDANDHWGKEYIELAASNRLLKGYDDGMFKPDREITYGEVATILLRTLNIYEISDSNTNWPEDCMNYAAKIGLFDGVATNDLLGMNPARRDNVALMIWNKIGLEDKFENLFDDESNLSGDNEENAEDSEANNNNQNEVVKDENTNKEENNDSNKENNNDNVVADIDTIKIYIGTVELITKRRGETFVTVKDFEGEEREIKVKDDTKVPDVHTLLIYKLTSKGYVKLKKQLAIEDTNKNYFLVEDVDNELVKLKNIEEILDLENDKVTISGETHKLYKYTFYLAEVGENKNGINEFIEVTPLAKEELKLQKEDRVIFDAEAKMMFVIRGLEVEEK